ncbi:MAG: hypothetical protein V1918_05575, partial [Planctomycetota bacterium]
GTARAVRTERFLALTDIERESLASFFHEAAVGMQETFTYIDSSSAEHTVRFAESELKFVRAAPDVNDINLPLEAVLYRRTPRHSAVFFAGDSSRRGGGGRLSKGWDKKRGEENMTDRVCILAADAEAPALRLSALGRALAADFIPAGDAAALAEAPAGSVLLVPEEVLFTGSWRGGEGLVRCGLLDGAEGRLFELPPERLEAASRALDALDGVFVFDPRAAAAARLVTKRPVAWLGFPHFSRNNAARPAQGSPSGARNDLEDAARPRILVLPAGEASFPEARTAGRLLVKSFAGFAPEFAQRAPDGSLLVPEGLTSAVALDARVRFGEELYALAEARVPCVGSHSLGAQALLWPELMVDPAHGMARARALLAEVAYSPAHRAYHAERAYVRLAEKASGSAVRARFDEALRGLRRGGASRP